MTDFLAAITGTVVFLGLGFYLLFRPVDVSERLRRFFSTYPLFRLAGEEQHTSRIGFVKVLGAVFILLGAAPLITLIFSWVL